jgi:tRNA/tmRNA/rRNA uracil-C5-methylase (TrmA/RlmC/RlmD family)
MLSVVDTLKARKQELEHELKQVEAAMRHFVPGVASAKTQSAPVRPPARRGWSPEMRAKMSARMKELWQQKKATSPQKSGPVSSGKGWNRTPEAKAKLSARMKELWKKTAKPAAKVGSKR